jgi:hypothetical protein
VGEDGKSVLLQGFLPVTSAFAVHHVMTVTFQPVVSPSTTAAAL